MKSHDYLIIGCGCFGSRAVETLLKKYPRSKWEATFPPKYVELEKMWNKEKE